MKKSILQKILSLLSLTIFIASCSSNNSNNNSSEGTHKIYSVNTEKEFEKIERSDFNPAPLNNHNQSNQTLKPKAQRTVINTEMPKEKQKTIAKVPFSPPSIEKAPAISSETTDTSKLSAKNQERLQEINQNLAFFCMKHRKDRAFKSEEQCLAFTRKVLATCEKKHKLINTVMVNCIKKRLKKR